MAKITYEEWLKNETEFVDLIYKSSKEDIMEMFWEGDQELAELEETAEEIIKAYKKLDDEHNFLQSASKTNPPVGISALYNKNAIIEAQKNRTETYNWINKFYKNKQDFTKGRIISNKKRAENAAQKQITLDKAVADYLDKAKIDGLDIGNKSVVAYFQNSHFRTQLKKPNGTIYTDSTFKRDIELAAANWRKGTKEKSQMKSLASFS